MAHPDPDRLAAALAPFAPRAAPPRAAADGLVSLILDVSGLDEAGRAALERDAKAALMAVPGVTGVRALLTAERRERRLIAVGSGKGGVGKSTIAANLAIAMARAGARVGLVDADIYGPSQPRLMGAEDARPVAEDKQLIPIPTRYGVPMLSMGQLVAPGKALAWRGPMASGALGQLVDARWEGIDWLVVDLPPGTGDVQLSMIQKHRPAAAVIVSTPQDVALIDAVRAMDLFATAQVPVLGLIENMAGYLCPACGALSHPFGHGGAEAEAARRGLPLLGRVPLDLAIRTASDAGTPPAAGEGPEAALFAGIAAAVLAAMEPKRG
ncbi:Mrp/NBP35 family ATP-binding protein [Sphingomonas morindae]|uniref:Iron-sulfur cluster carrier protein n=1 Tax=Sphingomonas morindae TaxID=1541170 RepID=A0ABY4X5Y3_9SPHN|nr:Mrp/NBP35 family ATP-binding protein [Sphingomonas morindae]USI72281.1 Mrp/NBP35 family ATP-binding protein [Sphingomonas morindae]